MKCRGLTSASWNHLKYYFVLFLLIYLLGGVSSCSGEEPDPGDLSMIVYEPHPVQLNIPEGFPRLEIPRENPLTQEGIQLGRLLFFDPILSIDSTISCSSCHDPKLSFTDGKAVSTGVNDQLGRRSAMSLLNMGFVQTGFFWDGRAATLEEQALKPVEDPIEMHEMWPNVVNKLVVHSDYPLLFRKAFGISHSSEITRDLAVKAIAQFERTLISSGNSKYDRVLRGEDVFSDEELAGYSIFFDIDPDIKRHAECGHCHNAPLFTTNEFANNGIEDSDSPDLKDKGLGAVSMKSSELGMFRIPSLRNISFSAPYMHDGRFNELDEVIQHYISGGHQAKNLSPIMRPLNLSKADIEALKSFIKTLDDPDFLSNPAFQSPF